MLSPETIDTMKAELARRKLLSPAMHRRAFLKQAAILLACSLALVIWISSVINHRGLPQLFDMALAIVFAVGTLGSAVLTYLRLKDWRWSVKRAQVNSKPICGC